MSHEPVRTGAVLAAEPADPRTAAVVASAEAIYGPAWPYALSTDFAVSAGEIDDWLGGRTEVPDFLVATLLRLVRIRAGAHAAVARALAEEIAAAPHGDYSWPHALARNARVLIRERDPRAAYDAEALMAAIDGHDAGEDLSDPVPAEEAPSAAPSRPPLYLVQGDARPSGYVEPRADLRDRI